MKLDWRRTFSKIKKWNVVGDALNHLWPNPFFFNFIISGCCSAPPHGVVRLIRPSILSTDDSNFNPNNEWFTFVGARINSSHLCRNGQPDPCNVGVDYNTPFHFFCVDVLGLFRCLIWTVFNFDRYFYTFSISPITTNRCNVKRERTTNPWPMLGGLGAVVHPANPAVHLGNRQLEFPFE